MLKKKLRSQLDEASTGQDESVLASIRGNNFNGLKHIKYVMNGSRLTMILEEN